MAGILLDVDGVLHVSGSPIAGAADAVRQLRLNGHRLRFVTNNTTHSRRRLADQIRGFGVELVGEGADAVLIGGADEGYETNQVFSYMNLARAFAELQAGAELYCLHKNRWWQTARGPLLDSGAFVAGLEYAAELEATVLGKPSPAYFQAALDALDSDAELTWMVGDDIEADIAGAHAAGLRTVLVRTGKFRPDAVELARVQPDGIITSIAALPGWIETAA